MLAFAALFLLIISGSANAALLGSYSPDKSNGIELVAAEDGKFGVTEAGGRSAVAADTGTQQYLHFKAPESARVSEARDLWLAVEFYESGPAIAQIHFNTEESPYAMSALVVPARQMWSTAVIKLRSAKLSGKQNSGADFRIMCGGKLPISKVELYDSEPTDLLRDWLESLKSALRDAPRPPGMSYCFGNDASLETGMLYRLLGATSVESYVTWETVEARGQGQWDWSRWDAQVEALKQSGLKWVPFLILSPAYSTPGWFRASEEHAGCVCLEHGITSKVESLWNPHLPKWIDRFIAEFAKRYRDSGVIESVLLGIQGDFGEAIYSVWGGGWTFDIPGEYHNHAGFWCNDGYALSDYRDWLEQKYGSAGALNAAWGTSFASFKHADFPGRGAALAEFRKKASAGDAHARRQWLDFIDWYRGSMTDWSDWWMATTRKHFPKTDIYLCTGGDAVPEHGSNFAEQCRVAAKHQAGVRITNEGSDYRLNFSVTRCVGSAGKHYGAYFGFEPAGAEDEVGIGARIFNATTSGARQLHDYNPNVVSTKSRIEAQRKHFPNLFHVSKPIVPIALWYPNVHLTLNWGGFLEEAGRMRDLADFDYVDESMLRTGALDSYRLLVIRMGSVMESSDARLIADWMRKGGRVIVAGVDRFQSVEGTDEPEQMLFSADLPEGAVVRVAADKLPEALARAADDLKLPAFDFKADGIFQSQISPDEILVLSPGATSSTIERKQN